MSSNENECVAADVDPAVVGRLARRLSRLGMEAAALGLTIFGGSGTGSLRKRDNNDAFGPGALIVADLDGGNWDGGDGAASPDADGLLRGEH